MLRSFLILFVAFFSLTCYGQTRLDIEYEGPTVDYPRSKITYDVYAFDDSVSPYEEDDPSLDSIWKWTVAGPDNSDTWQVDDPVSPDDSEASVNGGLASGDIGPMSGYKLALYNNDEYVKVGVKNEAHCQTYAENVLYSPVRIGRCKFAFDSLNEVEWDMAEEGNGSENDVLGALYLECAVDGDYDVFELNDSLRMRTEVENNYVWLEWTAEHSRWDGKRYFEYEDSSPVDVRMNSMSFNKSWNFSGSIGSTELIDTITIIDEGPGTENKWSELESYTTNNNGTKDYDATVEFRSEALFYIWD